MTDKLNCKCYKAGNPCDNCKLILTKQDTELNHRFDMLNNLKHASKREDLKFSCAELDDALLYLCWDSPEDATLLSDKHRKLIGGYPIIGHLFVSGKATRYRYRAKNN